MKSKSLFWAAGLTVAITLGGAARAQTIIPILDTGYDSVPGTLSGHDTMGNPWTWNLTTLSPGSTSPGKNYNAWGTPGLGLDEATYTNSTVAVDFEISFVFSKPNATGINQTPSPFAGGYNEWTRFDACDSSGGSCVEWAPSYPDPVNSREVDFFAPAGDELVAGDKFFVNVIFTTKKFGTSDVFPYPGFSAAFSTSVPEASTWAMLGIGFAGIGLVGLSKRRKGSRYAL